MRPGLDPVDGVFSSAAVPRRGGHSLSRVPLPSHLFEKAKNSSEAPNTSQMNEPVLLQKKTVKKAKPSRTNDPARTMAGILEVATAEFAEASA